SFDSVFTQPGSLQYQFPSDAVFDSNGNLLTANLGPTYPPELGGPGTDGAIFKFNSDGSFSQDLTSVSFPSVSGVTNFSPSQIAINLTYSAPTASAGSPYDIFIGQSLTFHASSTSSD